MIYSVQGKLIFKDPLTAVVECGGVGFGCKITNNTLKNLPDVGEDVFLYTYMNVREDAIELYGFFTKEELECYKLLITVNGIGPKAAISILSALSPNALARAIAMGDSKLIATAQGVGPKSAQRIVLELKDKIGVDIASADDSAESIVTDSGSKSEVISALVGLGYSRAEAASAVSKCDLSKSVDQIIKDALKYLF